MREKAIEAHLQKRVKELGGRAYKFESPGNAGVPDRIVLLPGGKVFFIEMKAPGKKSTVLQQKQQTRIKNLGNQVLVIDTKEGVDQFIAKVGGAE
jgi:hypothetical protein